MRKILLIEAPSLPCVNTREILSLSNYAVVSAPDPAAAVIIAPAERPDLVICDLPASLSDPVEAILSLQREPSLHLVPLLVLTDHAERAQLRKIMSLGTDDYLVKPFEGIELLRAVDACLLRRQRRAAVTAKPAGGVDHPRNDNPWHPDQRDSQVFKKKSLLYSEGQRASQVWYIVDGKVKTYRLNSEGKELITGIHGAGDCVGCAAAIEGGTQTDNAKVLGDARIIVLSRQEFLDIFNSDSSFARHLIQWLAHHAGEKEAGLINLAYSSLRKKVANGILSLSASLRQQQEGRQYITISRDNLAAFIGSAPESLTRTLGDFRKEGLIEISDGRIWLIDEVRLRKMFN